MKLLNEFSTDSPKLETLSGILDVFNENQSVLCSIFLCNGGTLEKLLILWGILTIFFIIINLSKPN